METKLFLEFIFFNILNVIIQTAKSIITVKSGKTLAAFTNAIAYGLYTYIIVLTMCELPIYVKAITVGLCNLVGVYIVKFMQEKMRKDKIWEVRATLKDSSSADALESMLINEKIPYTSFCTIPTTGSQVFNIYCATQKESAIVHHMLESFHAKYFISEGKSF